MLMAADAYPDLRQTIYVYDDTSRVEFGGSVISEDSQQPVELAIYLDYGQRNAAGRPYRTAIYPFKPIPPGTMADGARKFSGMFWHPSDHTVPLGCHTVTLMASHRFGPDVCPQEPTDASYLVWQVIRCASSSDCNDFCEPPPCDTVQGCASCLTPSNPDGSGEGQ
ncbi:uncharacterized protein CMC5_007990 [Chondromyces crocatus]|uniref:Uncharacterized protein n=2 Tax=Chondromyces crocatus TaxID=52 RepID=A0A0K1E754_CHOCO|nr:uncharacterized protein CMC5_007990 [Chondromyces crocatus]